MRIQILKILIYIQIEIQTTTQNQLQLLNKLIFKVTTIKSVFQNWKKIMLINLRHIIKMLGMKLIL